MAPRKRSVEGEKPETVAKRVTRRSTRLGNTNLVRSTAEANMLELAAKKKKPKGKAKALPKAKAQPKEQTQDSAKEMSEKLPESGTVDDKRKTASADAVTADGSRNKTIVIEHCKQCNSFKQRALLVKDGLEKGVSGITVLLNPDKPRKGCFEIREEAGQTFISLLEMKRPFKPMKELDMEKVISDVIDKIK